MTNRKGRERSKNRLADMTITEPLGGEKPWRPYRPEPADTQVHPMFGAPITRIVYVMWWDGTLLTDFVLTQQVNVGTDEDPDWVEIVRVDCRHGEVHSHLLYLSSSNADDVYNVIQSISTPEDLRKGAEAAEELVFGQWQQHLRRWEHGH